jgi:hypothetical protein
VIRDTVELLRMTGSVCGAVVVVPGQPPLLLGFEQPVTGARAVELLESYPPHTAMHWYRVPSEEEEQRALERQLVTSLDAVRRRKKGVPR